MMGQGRTDNFSRHRGQERPENGYPPRLCSSSPLRTYIKIQTSSILQGPVDIPTSAQQALAAVPHHSSLMGYTNLAQKYIKSFIFYLTALTLFLSISALLSHSSDFISVYLGWVFLRISSLYHTIQDVV